MSSTPRTTATTSKSPSTTGETEVELGPLMHSGPSPRERTHVPRTKWLNEVRIPRTETRESTDPVCSEVARSNLRVLRGSNHLHPSEPLPTGPPFMGQRAAGLSASSDLAGLPGERTPVPLQFPIRRELKKAGPKIDKARLGTGVTGWPPPHPFLHVEFGHSTWGGPRQGLSLHIFAFRWKVEKEAQPPPTDGTDYTSIPSPAEGER